MQNGQLVRFLTFFNLSRNSASNDYIWFERYPCDIVYEYLAFSELDLKSLNRCDYDNNKYTPIFHSLWRSNLLE